MKNKNECEECGSKFMLTEHHDKDAHLSRRNPKKDKHIIILCKTCHYAEDFGKDMACYTKAIMKRYDKKMNKIFS